MVFRITIWQSVGQISANLVYGLPTCSFKKKRSTWSDFHFEKTDNEHDVLSFSSRRRQFHQKTARIATNHGRRFLMEQGSALMNSGLEW